MRTGLKASSYVRNAPKRKIAVLTVWLLDVHNGVVVLEEVDFLNVRQRLDTYKGQREGGDLPNFFMADLSFLSSVT